MSQFKVDAITNRDGSHGPQVCGITTFTSSGMQLPAGPTEFRGRRGRGVIAGGYNYPSGQINTLQLIEIPTTGNATDFGDLVRSTHNMGSASNPIRGLFGGGSQAPINEMQYITIATL